MNRELHLAFSRALAIDAGQVFERVRRSLVQVGNLGHGAGAGLIWRADGLIVPNAHVTAGARHIDVELPGGRVYPARLAALDADCDLAALRIDAQDLPVALVADSRAVRVGELALAVGHPWGQLNFTTAGIISSHGTAITRGGRLVPVLHTDAALAPGNSGGPLVNAVGAVVGINTMILGGDRGLAIPAHVVTAFVERALARRTVPEASPEHVEAWL